MNLSNHTPRHSLATYLRIAADREAANWEISGTQALAALSADFSPLLVKELRALHDELARANEAVARSTDTAQQQAAEAAQLGANLDEYNRAAQDLEHAKAEQEAHPTREGADEVQRKSEEACALLTALSARSQRAAELEKEMQSDLEVLRKAEQRHAQSTKRVQAAAPKAIFIQVLSFLIRGLLRVLVTATQLWGAFVVAERIEPSLAGVGLPRWFVIVAVFVLESVVFEPVLRKCEESLAWFLYDALAEDARRLVGTIREATDRLASSNAMNAQNEAAPVSG